MNIWWVILIIVPLFASAVIFGLIFGLENMRWLIM